MYVGHRFNFFFAAWDFGELKISCTILYPKQFDSLRRAYGCENIVTESLARCLKWNDELRQKSPAFLKTRGTSHGMSITFS
jgi:1-phosphatidylinositol-3-phosphate 5-kinase